MYSGDLGNIVALKLIININAVYLVIVINKDLRKL